MIHMLSIFSSIMSRTAGGIENTTYYFAKEFANNNKVNVYLNRTEEIIKGVGIFETREDNVFARIFKGLRLYRTNKRKGELCLCLNWRFAVVPYLCNVPYVVMCHGNDVLDYSSTTIRGVVENVLRKRIINKAVHICANSQFTANYVKLICKKDNLTIIHPCSGEPVDFCEHSTKNGFILSIGRLEERKGIQYAIEAFKCIHQLYPKLKYYIAGDGPYKQVLQKLIHDYGLQEHCLLLGRVSEAEKKRLFKTCNLFVMPSFYNENVGSVEGFGIVYIEANAHGKPVIGTYSGGIPDAVINGKTGLLVEEKNVKQLVLAMDSILAGKVSISDAVCKNWAAKHYYPEIVKKYVTLIEELSKQYRF